MFGDIRTSVAESGEPLFCLADVCKALGLGNPSQVKTRLQQGGVITNEVGVKTGTKADGTDAVQLVSMMFITEPNLYKCIFQSRKKEAELFQDWVCGEVLPSIRKTGGYMAVKAGETPEQVMARALLLAKETIDRQQAKLAEAQSRMASLEDRNETLASANERQQTEIRDLQKSALFAKAVESSDSSILVGELAKIIRQNGVDIGQNRLFRWMRRNGYLCHRGEKYNQPTQKSLDNGLLEIKKTVIQKADGKTLVMSTPKVTGRGQVFFTGKFLAVAR